jgi:hypothetical protein
MAIETNPSESTSPVGEAPPLDAAAQAKLQKEIRRGVRNLEQKLDTLALVDRIQRSDVYHNHSMSNVVSELKKRHGERKISGEDLTAEAVEAIAFRPSALSPEAKKEYEQDMLMIDIRDVIAALFSIPGEKPMSLTEAGEREAELLDPNTSRLFRQQRLLEQEGYVHEDGTLTSRVGAWRNSDEGKKAFDKQGALKIGRYALMAGILLGTGGAAAPGMVAAHFAGKLQLGKRAGNVFEGLRHKTSDWLVDNGVVSAGKMGRINETLDKKSQQLSSSKLGTFGRILGGVVIAGGAAYLAGEAVGFDRVSSAWADLTVVTDNSLESQFEPLPDVAETADVAAREAVVDHTYDIPVHIDPSQGEVIHPYGGIDKSALIEQLQASGSQSPLLQTFISQLEQMPDQLTEDGLRDALVTTEPSARFMGSGTLIDMASNQFNLSSEALRSALSNPVVPMPEGALLAESAIQEASPASASSEMTTEEHNAFQSAVDVASRLGNAINAEALASTAEQPLSDGMQNVSFTPVDIDVPSDAGDGDVAVPETMTVAEVTVEVPEGSTLSDTIWEQYQQAGIPLSAAELYAPSEMSSHPQGLVGEMAAVNQLANPDVIAVGSTLTISVPVIDVPDVATSTLDEVAIAAAEQVAPQPPMLDDVAIDMAIAAVEAAEGGQALSPDAMKSAIAAANQANPFINGAVNGEAIERALASLSSGGEAPAIDRSAMEAAILAANQASPFMDNTVSAELGATATVSVSPISPEYVPGEMDINEEFFAVEGMQVGDLAVPATVAAGVGAANLAVTATGLDKDLEAERLEKEKSRATPDAVQDTPPQGPGL